MSLNWIERPKYSHTPWLAAYRKIESPSQQEFANRCIRWINSPDTVEELAQIENFLELLCSGVVFFHNRKPSINELIFNKLGTAFEYYEVLRFMSDQITFSDYKSGNWLSYRNTDKLPILVIESSNIESITNFVSQMRGESVSRHYGIWICGYISELETFIPSSFQALFLFDTSTQELDSLKRRIALSDPMIATLRGRQVDSASGESVLFFWNYEAEPHAPLLDMNPKVLGISRKVGPSALLEEGTSSKIVVTGGVSVSGDTYQISGGQVGAAGSHAHAHDMTFTQIGSQIEKTVDLLQLADELSKLRQAMKKDAAEAEQDIAISDVAKAEQAARAKDASKVAEYLKSAGKWALDVATKIGAALAIEALKQATGL